MTISTTTSRASYNGNGVTTVFSVPFRFFQDADLVVELVTTSTGASTPLTLTTHYTVTGADEEAGGSLTMFTAPAVGERLVIRRVIAATQEVDYISGESFPAETHERALDRLTMLAQQTDEVQDRSLTVPVADSAFDTELPPISASKYLRVNAAGDKFELVSAVDSGTLVVSPFVETLLDDADAAAAQTTLGGTTVGKAVFTAADAAAARAAIGIETKCCVAQSGTLSLTSGAVTQITSFTEIYDTTNSFSAGVFTVPESGVYDIKARVNVQCGASGNLIQVTLIVYKNGSTSFVAILLNANTSSGAGATSINGYLLDTASLVAGDTLDVRVMAVASSGSLTASLARFWANRVN